MDRKHKNNKKTNAISSIASAGCIELDRRNQEHWEKYNHLIGLKSLSNRFFVLRHGHSLANKAGKIASENQNGITKYGLSKTGKQEVMVTVYTAVQKGIIGPACLIYSSPFLRTKDTAHIVAKLLAQSLITYDERLRERFYGKLELTSVKNYRKVWKEDFLNPEHHEWGVESVFEVLDRSTSLVSEINRARVGQNIILITHGDVGQILESGFLRQNPKNHRLLRPLKTGELRELCLHPLLGKAEMHGLQHA